MERDRGRQPHPRNEYTEQQMIERVARARFPHTTGVREIQPFIMADEKADNWLVTLTKEKAFIFQTTLVTDEDIRGLQGQQKKQ